MRPWVLRALVMALLYGVGQAGFVALSSRAVELTLLWSILLLGALLLVGLVWGGAEVITDRVPPEWTWLKASLAAGPGAGLLTWLLLTLFVDAVGVEDLGSAVIFRASFTVLLILASSALGSWLGWLSLHRSHDPRAERDPGADRDEPGEPQTLVAGVPGPGESGSAGSDESDVALPVPASTAERVAARRARRREEQSAGTRPAPGSRPIGSERADEPPRVPFGSGPFADAPDAPQAAPAPGGHASPVVAVLPEVTPLPDAPGSSAREASQPTDQEPDDQGRDGSGPRRGKRRFGLRRPDDD